MKKEYFIFSKIFCLGHDANPSPNWWFEKLHMIFSGAFFVNVSNVPANTQMIEFEYSNFRDFSKGNILFQTHINLWWEMMLGVFKRLLQCSDVLLDDKNRSPDPRLIRKFLFRTVQTGGKSILYTIALLMALCKYWSDCAAHFLGFGNI